MPRPPKSPEERKAARSAANKRYYQRHKEVIKVARGDRCTPAPELWLTLRYHPSLADFVQSAAILGIPNKLFKSELEALMRVIEIISGRWEECEAAEEESTDEEERISWLL
jgi:hypothetical protein